MWVFTGSLGDLLDLTYLLLLTLHLTATEFAHKVPFPPQNPLQRGHRPCPREVKQGRREGGNQATWAGWEWIENDEEVGMGTSEG